MLNKVQLIGNLGRDPELNETTGGKKVANFTLATNERWKDAKGNKVESTEWHQIVCWERLAEIAAEHLEKGRLVYLEGRLETQSWDDKETGDKRYRTHIVAHKLQMLPKGGNGGNGEGS